MVLKTVLPVSDCMIGEQTASPCFGANDPRLTKPRFERVVDRQHPLWRAHAGVDAAAREPLTAIIREMETNCVNVSIERERTTMIAAADDQDRFKLI